MCGIVGLLANKPVAGELYESLIHLQHRGQDAAGILTCDQRFYMKQGLGLAREIFNPTNIASLKGNIGIAHTRYPTAGGYSREDIQPLWVGSPRGIALAHNGNLTNFNELADEIRRQHRHLNTSLDSEALLVLFADYLSANSSMHDDDQAFFQGLCHAVRLIFERVRGSMSVVSVVIGKGLIAFRDPHGIRPLVWGQRDNDDGSTDSIIASETTPFYNLGFNAQGDVLPGEVMYINQAGQVHRRVITTKAFRPCVFEYVYFARPDALLNEVSVYRARLRMGQNLAAAWIKKFPHLLPDVVIPTPFTANTAALSFAHQLGVRYSEGLYKNPFIGRTFIMPNQTARTSSIRRKLTPQLTEINNKIVLIVDDSIVRGSTSREIVKMVREFGAKQIYFVSTCPPIVNPCFYGIDIPTHKELIAASFDEQAIAKFIGVDALLYQTQEDLIEAVTRRGENGIKRPCMACMDGDYFCSTLTANKMKQLESERSKSKTLQDATA